MASSKYKYTMVAAKAVSLAELFVQSFEKGLDGPVHFKVEMSAPDGPSTSGGKQALQHIKLIPDNGGMAVVIGSADTTTGQAEVRTFDHIATLYAQRFKGATIPIDAGKYNELSQTLSNFFRSMNMKVTFAELEGSAEPVATAAAVEPARTGPSGLVLALIGVVVAALVVGGAYFLVFVKR